MNNKAGSSKVFLLILASFAAGGVAVFVLMQPVTPAPTEEASTVLEETKPLVAMTVLAGSKTVKVIQETPAAQSSKDCPLPDVAVRVSRISPEGMEILTSTGMRLRMGFDCTLSEAALSPGISNPSGMKTVRAVDPRADGASVLAFYEGDEVEEVTLRSGSRPYRDPEVVGWMDDNRAIVVTFRGSSRVALSVEPTGRISELASLPETASEFHTSPGAFWYVLTTPGPGLESDPIGPSEVHRVNAANMDVIVAQESKAGIDELHIDPMLNQSASSSLVYGMSGQRRWVQSSGASRDLGADMFLGWSADGGVFIGKAGTLFRLTADGAATDLKHATAGVTDVWRVEL